MINLIIPYAQYCNYKKTFIPMIRMIYFAFFPIFFLTVLAHNENICSVNLSNVQKHPMAFYFFLFIYSFIFFNPQFSTSLHKLWYPSCHNKLTYNNNAKQSVFLHVRKNELNFQHLSHCCDQLLGKVKEDWIITCPWRCSTNIKG